MANARDVDALHHPWRLPFELVDRTPQEDTPTWAVVLEDGNLLEALGPFAPAIVARVQGAGHVLATRPWAEQAAARFLAAQPEQDCAWLIRLARPGAGSPELLILHGPEPVQPRTIRNRGIALLMDFGKVLCHFDYNWFSWSHAAVFGHKPSSETLVKIEALRPAFEAGDIAENTFFEHCANHLGLFDANRKMFDAAWANILRLHNDMAALLRHARNQPGWTSVIVSNIDPIMVRETVARFELADIFDQGVYSYHKKVRPKHEDGSMWKLATKRCHEKLDGDPQLVIATDDMPANLLTAAAEDCVDDTIRFHNP
ncbi:MAG: hypothetical protein MK209_10245, partial [Planctomycetes bacterium]|nr:hypothetical protein [Planctomycetota bacterium]